MRENPAPVHNALPERRPLGKTGLLVSPLCIGCAPLGNMPETFTYSVAEEQALATIRAIFAGPINFLDTAASYSDGENERSLGLVIREMGRLPPGFVLARKADRDLRTGEFSGEQMRRSVERSLRLLGLDQIQLLYLHDPEHISFEQAMAPGGPVEALQRCEYALPLAAVALQFSLRHPLLSSTIVGISWPERLAETIALSQVAIPAELWTALEEVMPGQPDSFDTPLVQ